MDLSELKAEKTFKEERGRESLSENHTFVLWLDNANPKLVVLSMVRKIPEGDVTNPCYRFLIQIQDGDSLATPTAGYAPEPVTVQATGGLPSGDAPPPGEALATSGYAETVTKDIASSASALDAVVGLATLVYHDNNMDCTRTDLDRFAMASKTPDEAWGKRPRTTGERLALAGGRAERQNISSAKQRKTAAGRKGMAADHWKGSAGEDVVERVDAAAELVKLLSGNQQAATYADKTGDQGTSPTVPLLLPGMGQVAQQAAASQPAALSGAESFHRGQAQSVKLPAGFSGGDHPWPAPAAAGNGGGLIPTAPSLAAPPSHIYSRPSRLERLGGSGGGCERIMAERGWAHTRELLVRWRQGADEVPVEDSWEPYDALCAEPGARQAVGAWEILRQHQQQ